MRILTRNLILATVVAGLLATGVGSSAAATNAQKSKKIKVNASAQIAAKAAYKQAIDKARADFIAAVKPSRDAVVAVGKPAETVRRAKVSAALKAYTSVATAAKAPSLAAEVAYKKALAALVANPNDATLKANFKTALATLTSATAALKLDATVADARVVFHRTRLAAMTEFKATIASAVKARTDAQTQALVRYRTAKQTASANLKVALKASVATNKVSSSNRSGFKKNKKSIKKTK